MSGAHCPVHASSTGGCALAHLLRVTYYEDLAELEAQRELKERPEEGGEAEEPKRCVTWDTARGRSLFEAALLAFEAQDPNVEQCTKAAAVI